MKIFQILEFNQFNTGSVHQMFQAASGLRERGHDVAIISRPDVRLEAKAREHGVVFYGFAFRSQFDFATIRALRTLFGTERPDVIHVHKGKAHGLSLLATLGQPVPAFVVNRGVSFPLDFWNGRKYRTPRVDRVVTVCQQIKEVIVSSAHLPSEKVEVVYAGTDVALFDPQRWDRLSFRREKGLPGDRFVIAQVGVRDWKGWKELIDSVSDVVPRHPRIHLLLIGCRGDEERKKVAEYAHLRGVSAHVTPVEYRDDMPNVFAACDLVVDASWGGTGITGTIREAMAMQRAVIATDCGGNRELVSSPEVGWLIPMKDRAALSNAIVEVIEDPGRTSSIAANARQHVQRGFSKDLRISHLETLYASIVASKRESRQK
ncbi:MAG: glycosyltransferase family 4 protein [Acidobacteriota bacterium]